MALQGNNLTVNYTAPAPLVKLTVKAFAPLSASSFQVNFSGPIGQSYSLLSSTNVALPIADWTVLSSGTFNGSPVIFTDYGASNVLQFYRIKSP